MECQSYDVVLEKLKVEMTRMTIDVMSLLRLEGQKVEIFGAINTN